jgi:hypothetical protein
MRQIKVTLKLFFNGANYKKMGSIAQHRFSRSPELFINVLGVLFTWCHICIRISNSFLLPWLGYLAPNEKLLDNYQHGG